MASGVVVVHLFLLKPTHAYTRIMRAMHTATQPHYDNDILQFSRQLITCYNPFPGGGGGEWNFFPV